MPINMLHLKGDPNPKIAQRQPVLSLFGQTGLYGVI